MSKWKQVLGDSVHVVIRVLLPFAHLNYGTGFIYQQDNASIHASKRTKEFFAEQDINFWTGYLSLQILTLLKISGLL
ncbi:hypothetical protein F441_01451 [Phytophthora nicotianae CJ01A1]|uniref:Tc1-like transposase DDE domain-containing protein n=1 Tax=Phytophthora nicotianae CJ01A1 TaxID=1317063 RepID=W2XS76_PHYNI|nr:hypothetical protein F441_01451 [Phytophthora nicotianae CJ01A1]